MKLNYDRKSKDPTYFIQVGIRNGKKVTTKNIERIGKHSELLKITDDPLEFAKKKVKEYYDSARAHKTTGDRKTIEMIDLWAYKETYLEMNNELWKYAKKFASVEYQHLSDIDDDMYQFNSIIDRYAKKLEKIQEKTIIVPVDKVIRFYEDETTGNSDVIKTLQKNMDEFQKMESEAINLEKRADRYGPEILPKKINFIRKMVLSITNRINKAVIKFMTLLILIF